jgi:hypothetical protein
MWQWTLEFSRTRRARRAAVAAISPIVQGSRQRLGGISDGAWSDPYIIGFLVMLISIIARLESGKMSTNSLCAVQRNAWRDITETRSEGMAEQLLLLSADRNRDFELGCSNAAAFGTILFGSDILLEGAGLRRADWWQRDPEDSSTSILAHREDVDAAWTQWFDAHIASGPPRDAK